MQDRHYDLSVFSKQRRVASTPDAWNETSYDSNRRHRLKDYSLTEIEQILNSSSLESKRILSRNYCDKGGFYSRIIAYYATVIYYYGILIPNPSYGKSLTLPHIQKRYTQALDYIDNIQLQNLFVRFSVKALLDGCYFGVLSSLDKNELIIIDLPGHYCRSRFKDIHGNDIIEFNISYFDTILDKAARQEALRVYPSIISSYYRKWINNKAISQWVQIPSEIGLCFPFNDSCIPPFINIIPAIIKHEQGIDKELEREEEEIRKIIIQKIPHLTSTGELVFEPDEAMEMHEGAVSMLSGNKNLSVLTTYADVEAIVSKTGADTVASAIEQLRQNIYANTGASPQLFAPTGSQALPYSIKNDIALMMVLVGKYETFISYIINSLFGNSNISFRYKILPVGIYNQSEYIDEVLKLAQNGYSSLLPAIASGLTQNELINLRCLENDVLKLNEVLIPLSNSFNQSSEQQQVGRPTKSLEEKSAKTIQNEAAIDNSGGA